jgi:hypothetical protein
MFKKILSLFKSEKKDEIVMKLKDLEQEFKIKRLQYHENVAIPRFDSLIVKIQGMKEEVEVLSNSLENAVLKNQKITIRERQFMEGNRESYVKHTKILLRVDLPRRYEEISAGYEEFMKSLEIFGSQTMRPKQILSHFFEHETESVHLAIYKIKKEYDKLNSLAEDDINKAIIRLESALHKYSNLMAKRKALNGTILAERKNISDLKSELERITQQIKQESESVEYKSYCSLVGQKKQIESAIKSKDDAIAEIFSPVMRALKKYERSAMDLRECLVAMLASPKTALVSFDSEKVLAVLENLKAAVEGGRLNFNDEKEKGKILRGISNLLEDGLVQSLRKDLLEKISALKSVEETLEHDISRSKLDSLREKHFIVDKKLSDHISLQNAVKGEFDSLDEDFLKREIAQDYGIIIQRHVKII